MTKTCFAVTEGTVYIRADGSIDPPTAPISTIDNVTYTLTGDIFNDSIVIERNNIVIDGKDFSLNGMGLLWRGITLDSRNNVTVQNIKINGFTYGVWVHSSSNITISRNIILIQEPLPSIYPSGIHLETSSNSSIMENQVSVTASEDARSISGIYLDYSHNNTIVGNNVTHNAWIGALSGISFYYSQNNLMRNNSVAGNSSYLFVGGTSVEDFVNDVDSSNTVGGKPVCYWINEENRTVPINAGYVALINCSNIKAESLTMSQGYPAVTLVNTYNSTITKSRIEKGEIGILLLGAYNNSILQNDLVGNMYGIYLMNFGSANTSYNMVVGNNITMNDFGVWNEGSSGNTFYHNNFINNSWTHVRLLSNIREIWDNGFEGNYWSDYTGTDNNQDGIGDTPYVIDENNTDHYPLMGTFQSFNVSGNWSSPSNPFIFEEVDIISNSTIGKVEFLLADDVRSPTGLTRFLFLSGVIGQNGTTGFCRITFPNKIFNSSRYPVFIGNLSLIFDVRVDRKETPSRILESNGTHTTLYFSYSQPVPNASVDDGMLIFPEFPSFLILPLFMIATLLAVMVYKKKGVKTSHS